MTELPDLVKAVVDNPGEDTPVSMLADHLIERGDGRGEILRRWVTEPDSRVPHYFGNPYTGVNPENEGPTTRTYLGGGIHDHKHLDSFVQVVEPRLSDGRQPIIKFPPQVQFTVRLHHGKQNRTMNYRTGPTSAREVADTLPNSEEVHAFLDHHFGPRPSKPEHFARQYGSAIKPTETV